jgi:hypothetical protein
MPNYLFLDNWVLSKYAQRERHALLSAFIQRGNYTILLNSLAFTELYNPGWNMAQGEERADRVVAFLIQHPCVIVDPVNVFRAELLTYPEHIQELPVALDLANIPAQQRHDSLLGFLRRDSAFLAQGKDIQEWVAGMERLKATWLETVDAIIADASAKNALRRDRSGRFIDLPDCKEALLLSLDRRHLGHLSAIERESLGPDIISLMMGGLAQLPAIRLTSLCFWYAYIDIDKTNPMKRQGSDISDFYQMSLIPYCSTLTTDNTMYRLLQRIHRDVPFPCSILNKDLLDVTLQSDQ